MTGPDIPLRLFIALLEKHGEATLRAQGCSMRPFICHGDTLTLVRVSENDILRRGDIVMALTGSGEKNAVIHRIYSFAKGGRGDNGPEIILMGDSNRKRVELCRRSGIIARVVKIFGRNGDVTDCRGRRFIFYSTLWRRMVSIRPLLQQFIR